MPSTVKLAAYLFTRLRQLNISSVHGVPGDYNLVLLDYVAPAGLHWVGNTNELNAGYAADGYARINGVGALVTTFGVGELSAINAVAGAYAERAAVVHVVGTPELAAQDEGRLIHHTFNDGNFRRFAQMHAHVTVAQASLRDPEASPEMIDDVLSQCLLHSRPVYIEVPMDLVEANVSAARLQHPITVPEALPDPHWEDALTALLDRIYSAKQPLILVDGETRALGIVDAVQALSRLTNWPTYTTVFGKGLLDETAPNFHGIYKGSYAPAAAQDYFKSADLVLVFGPHFSSTNSYSGTAIPAASAAVLVTDSTLTTPNQTFANLPARFLLTHLLQTLDAARVPPAAFTPPPLPPPPDTPAPNDLIMHSVFWPRVAAAQLLQAGEVLLAETGTAAHGARDLALPRGARAFFPATWLSIGYMLPAAQGAALAVRERSERSGQKGAAPPKAVLFIGDGSVQMTVQELSTIIREGLDVLVILLNNAGYTIERVIHGLRAGYNDVGAWEYGLAGRFLGAGAGFAVKVQTWAELEDALSDERVLRGRGLRVVEVLMGREDVPEGVLKVLLEKEKERVGAEAEVKHSAATGATYHARRKREIGYGLSFSTDSLYSNVKRKLH
ncbi:uncharacterized protein K452DRAFT_329038 [Aplosporella prunicola CBS 121167]|uniref:Pyruvate decarboxylase n=1 Tax=Aplosporella prunicola CBS 121167 TaxID=1176127 RepID=A0A6A6B265_9PEZI|nr:uncharacterized protein K452DRAFT_329038 [Aplosporella prunicola CBS 121167]KAF2138150.1 hypothetical protein K452DRAFT_329038 [Aplosporella prunicola CBS 121167]